MGPVGLALLANLAVTALLVSALRRSENRRARRLRRGRARGELSFLRVKVRGFGVVVLGETLELAPLPATDVVLDSHEVILTECTEQEPREFRLRAGQPLEVVRLDMAERRRELPQPGASTAMVAQRFTCELEPDTEVVVAARVVDAGSAYRDHPVIDLAPAPSYAIAASEEELLAPVLGGSEALVLAVGVYIVCAIPVLAFSIGLTAGLVALLALYLVLTLATVKLVRDGNVLARHERRVAKLPPELRRQLPRGRPDDAS
ncbi:MAG: hypothetical protein KC731_24740 [Myxococcales bacterium]|nr:hypothetical protein [Myxococcales bacterium]